MEIIKIIIIAVIGSIAVVYLKETKSELSNLCLIATGVILIIVVFDYLLETIQFFTEFSNSTGINNKLFLIIIKITIISYLIDFSKTLCEDFGVKALGMKVEFCGKIIIFVMAIPIIKNLIEVMSELIL